MRGINPHIGIQSFKNNASLRNEDEIEPFAKWVDAGAPMGNAADMPKPREFDDPESLAYRQAGAWTISHSQRPGAGRSF